MQSRLLKQLGSSGRGYIKKCRVGQKKRRIRVLQKYIIRPLVRSSVRIFAITQLYPEFASSRFALFGRQN